MTTTETSEATMNVPSPASALHPRIRVGVRHHLIEGEAEASQADREQDDADEHSENTTHFFSP